MLPTLAAPNPVKPNLATSDDFVRPPDSSLSASGFRKIKKLWVQ